MTIRTTQAAGAFTRLAVEGSMTVYEAVEQKKGLLEALAGAQALELDLSAVDEIDTAGLQLLFLARREGCKTDKPVRLVAKSDALTEVLGRYGLGSSFDEPAAPAA